MRKRQSERERDREREKKDLESENSPTQNSKAWVEARQKLEQEPSVMGKHQLAGNRCEETRKWPARRYT